MAWDICVEINLQYIQCANTPWKKKRLFKEEFRLTYGKLGPTEFRLIVIIVNTLFIYTPWRHRTYFIGNEEFGIFDLIGADIALIIFVMHLVQWFHDRKELSLKDPAKPYNPTK